MRTKSFNILVIIATVVTLLALVALGDEQGGGLVPIEWLNTVASVVPMLLSVIFLLVGVAGGVLGIKGFLVWRRYKKT